MDIGKLIQLPKNSDFILFQTLYHNKVEDNPDVQDAISLIFKNMNTGEKFIKTIDNPQMEIYVAKPEVDLGDYDHIDIDLADTQLVDVSYKNIVRDMYKILGEENTYWNCIKERRFDDLKRIKECNRFFSSDRNIEDFYKYKCLHHFGMKELRGTTKGFYDIEADISKGKIDFKNGSGTAPVNAITFIDGSSKISYTMALRDPDNPLIQEVENDIRGFIQEAHEMFDEEFGHFDYKLAFFDTEEEVIETFFKLSNGLKLDFMLAWNMGFDMAYMIDRIDRLGRNPKDVICHPDFRYQVCDYRKDMRNYEIKKKTDSFICSSYSIYMDQMINYASIRKSQSQFDSYKLDYIGEVETGSKKLEYEGHIRDFPYKDYKRFLLYNIKDVLLQWKIEETTNDIGTLFYRAYAANTRYNKIFKEITFLTNVAFDEFESYGIILGNNVNAIRYNRDMDNVLIDENGDEEDSDKKKKFKGALVGNPVLIMKVGIALVGKHKSNSVFNFIVDYDYTSLYPTILAMFNIYKSTLIGKVEILGEPGEREARVLEEGYNRGSKFMEDMESKEPIFIGNRWFGLPSFEDTMLMVEEALTREEKYVQVKVSKVKENVEKEKIRKLNVRRIK